MRKCPKLHPQDRVIAIRLIKIIEIAEVIFVAPWLPFILLKHIFSILK